MLLSTFVRIYPLQGDVVNNTTPDGNLPEQPDPAALIVAAGMGFIAFVIFVGLIANCGH